MIRISRIALADVLRIEGYQIEVANSGEEAIKKFRSHDFDLTFMDVRLPGKNGLETFFEIRKIKADVRVGS